MVATTKTAVAKARKFSEDTQVTIVNNTRGRLGYTNRQMQDWTFGNTGDELEMSIKDLREMKTSHLEFFEKQWITFADEDRDAIQFLKIEKYYQELITPEYIEEKLLGDEIDFIKFIKSANYNIRALILSIARELYKTKALNNAQIVRCIEDTLDADIDIENPRK